MMLPARFDSVEAVEDFMTAPSETLIADLARTPGDIIVLGVGGKMGPTLARMAKRAAPGKRVMGVARFSEPGVREALVKAGVEQIPADLLDRAALETLPRAENVVFMAGRKFGATGDVPLTWAMNVQVPAMVGMPSASLRPPTPTMAIALLPNNAAPRAIDARFAFASPLQASYICIAPGANAVPAGSAPSTSFTPT